MAFCELLQEEITDEVCTKCWQDQMEELAKEYEANRLTIGKPRTIEHSDCKRENLIKEKEDDATRKV